MGKNEGTAILGDRLEGRARLFRAGGHERDRGPVPGLRSKQPPGQLGPRGEDGDLCQPGREGGHDDAVEARQAGDDLVSPVLG